MSDTIEKRNIRTLAKMKDMWEANIVANSPYIKHDVAELWNNGRPIDGCLVSASPCLKDNLLKLKERSRSSRYTEVCAVDMSLKYLLANGIRPDYVITCEAKPEAYKMLDVDYDGILVADVMTNPDIIKNWKGKMYFFVTNNPCIDLDNNNELFYERHKKLSGIDTMLTIGGSVGTAGLSFMLSVRNVSKLYLYGHEFCWKDSNEFYCGGIQQDLAKKRIDTEQVSGTVYEKTDMNGDKVYTNLSLLTFLEWYKGVINRYPNTIVNESGAGLLN